MTRLLSRVGALFFEGAGAPAPAPAPATSQSGSLAVAAVLGVSAAVVAVAAACAGELRARSGAPTALLAVWRPARVPAPELELPAARSPAGATTPGASRLAARLIAHDLAATACGRLAWLLLEPDPVTAAEQFRRCRVLAAAPLVLAVAGPRPAQFEPLIADLDLCVAVLPSETEPALRELALASLPARENVVLPPLPAGPPRWAAMAGLARLRSLPGGPQ